MEDAKEKLTILEGLGMVVFGLGVALVEAFILYMAWGWFFIGSGITSFVLPLPFIYGMLWVKIMLSKQNDTLKNGSFKDYSSLLISRLFQILLVFGIMFVTSLFL